MEMLLRSARMAGISGRLGIAAKLLLLCRFALGPHFDG